MAVVSITEVGISQAISSLNYKHNSIKDRVVQAIRNVYAQTESIDRIKSIDTDQLIREIWNLSDNPVQIRAKRRNFYSLRSAIIGDLEKLSPESENPESITISPNNTFDISEAAKNEMLNSFSEIAQNGNIDLNQVADVLSTISNFLSKVDIDEASKNQALQKKLAQIKEQIQTISDATVSNAMPNTASEKSEDGVEHGNKAGAGETGQGEGRASLTDNRIEEQDFIEAVDGFEDIDEDDIEEVEDQDIIEIDEDTEIEEVEDDDFDLTEEDLEESEDVEEIDQDLIEAVDDFEDIDEDDIEEVEDQDIIEIDEDTEIEEVEDDDFDLTEEDLEESEDVEEIDQDLIEAVDDFEDIDEDDIEEVEDQDIIEIDEDTEIEEVEDDDFDLTEEDLEESEDVEEIDQDLIEAVDDFEDIDEDDIEEVEDQDIIEIDEDTEIEEVEDDDFDLSEEDLEESEDVEEIDQDLIEAVDDFEDIDEDDIEEVEDQDIIEIDEKTEIEEVEDDDFDLTEEDIEESEDVEEIDQDLIEAVDGFEDIDEDDIEEVEDQDIIEIDEDTEIEEVEDDDFDLTEEDLEESEDVEEIDQDLIEAVDGFEDINEDDIEEVEDEEIIEVDEDTEIEEVEDDDFDLTEEDLEESEDVEEIDQDLIEAVDGFEDINEDDIEEVEDEDIIEIDEDTEIEEVEDDDFDLTEENLDEEEIDENEFEAFLEFQKERELADHFDHQLSDSDKKYNQYVTVPQGNYTIGSTQNIKNRLPLQEIELKKFYIGKYPVTNSLFEAFIQDTGYITTAEKRGFGIVFLGRFKKEKNQTVWRRCSGNDIVKKACWYQPTGPGSSLHQKKHHPVVQVSVEDATAFASWIGRRLPTETEWEAMARTDQGLKYPWGNQWIPNACNTEQSAIGETTPVDKYEKYCNPLNISDLLGNTMEWTIDTIPNPYSKGKKDLFHVAKSCAWNASEHVTIGSRSLFKTGYTSNIIGFRCISEFLT